MQLRQYATVLGLLAVPPAASFAPIFPSTTTTIRPSPSVLHQQQQQSNGSNGPEIWNPGLRKFMAGLASVGVVETAYLTVSHLTSQSVFCPIDTISEAAATSSCSSVLNGPYSEIPGTNIPIAALGLLAYSVVGALALFPLLPQQRRASISMDDTYNRMWLTVLCTTMGVFSAFLMSLLFGVLHENCPYCVASASLSFALALSVWLGGALPKEHEKEGVTMSVGGAALSFFAALTLFFSNDPPAFANPNLPPSSPPPITTDSSLEALNLARDLQKLDTHFYGAFWCSHCFDQKQALGKQAMEMIPYIECSRDGMNSQSKLCKSKEIPGYPTWEIAGTLYPGEQAISELREIIETAKKDKL